MKKSLFPLIFTVFFLLLAGAIYIVLYIPLTQSVPAFSAEGTVIARTFDGVHAVGNPGVGMKTGNQIAIDDRYLIDIRLDSGEVVRGVWPPFMIDRLPIGQRVSVQCEHRGFPPLWEKTVVREIVPLDAAKPK